MLEVKEKLGSMNHEVKIPPTNIKDENGNMIPVQKYYELRKQESNDDSWIWDEKEKAMRNHFYKVVWSDAVLVLNYEKKGIKGYVGANTLHEIGLAFHLGKSIYFLNGIPEISYKEEILGMKPIILNRDLEKIR